MTLALLVQFDPAESEVFVEFESTWALSVLRVMIWPLICGSDDNLKF